MRPSVSFWLGLAILGIVFYALVTPRIYSRTGDRPTAALADIKGGIKSALDYYKLDNGHYPIGTNGLFALCQKTSDATNWHGPYFDPPKIPIDPWGDPYIYECPGKHRPDSYDLFSAGPDGRIGTADDIVNWTK